jgi:hypothetical protein
MTITREKWGVVVDFGIADAGGVPDPATSETAIRSVAM